MTTTVPTPAEAAPGERLAVDTGGADSLRATVAVAGVLSPATCPLLTSVLVAHRRAGRRYLRVDLTGCRIADPAVLAELRAAHAALAELGGLLVFDNADDEAAAVLRRGDLFVSARR